MDGRSSAGGDEEVRNLNGSTAGVGEGDLKIHRVEGFCVISRWKREALADLKSIGLRAFKKDLALRAVGGHFKPAKHLARVEPKSTDGHSAAAIQGDIFMILSEVHAQDDLLDATGVIIENKFCAIRGETLGTGGHDRSPRARRTGCGIRCQSGRWRRRRRSGGGGRRRHLRLVVFADIPLPDKEAGDGENDGDPGFTVH